MLDLVRPIAGLFIISVLGVWTYRYWFIPFWEQRRLTRWMNLPEIVTANTVYTALYRGISGQGIARKEREQRNNSHEFVYGEVVYISFAAMLKKAKPQPGEVFYDLGCGAGKAVFTAALLHEFSACRGVEISRPMYDLCCMLLEKFEKLPKRHELLSDQPYHIDFINHDITRYDFSDGDVVFVNATCFMGETWDAILATLHQLKSGARVILTSKRIDSDAFELVDVRRRLMSWGMATVTIYRKR